MLRQSFNEEDNKYFKYRKWSSLFLSKIVSLIWKKMGMKSKIFCMVLKVGRKIHLKNENSKLWIDNRPRDGFTII